MNPPSCVLGSYLCALLISISICSDAAAALIAARSQNVSIPHEYCSTLAQALLMFLSC